MTARLPITVPRTPISTPRLTSHRSALRNQPYSLYFGDGATDNVEVPISFDPSTTPYTFMAWVNPAFLPQPWFSPIRNHNIISQKDGTGTGRSWGFAAYSPANANKLQSFFNGVTQDGNYTLQQNYWIHFCQTYDPTTQVLKFYVNGIVRATINSLVVTSATGNLVIGNDKFQGASVFDGFICDVRFYETALTAQEISDAFHLNELYESDLVFWLLGTDGSGATITDVTGNGHDGVITGARWATKTPTKATRGAI